MSQLDRVIDREQRVLVLRVSPEDFVQLHPGAVGNYSARTVRRWLASNKIPPFVIPYLQVFLADK